jgi:dTDP-4-amino-4,6-dideoxygalactose transaminase
MNIPFVKPFLTGNEFRYMQQAIESGRIAGDGHFTRKCSELLENALGVPKVLLTTSCTHALEMAALLLDIQPGDEVIVPSFTFVSTVNAFILRGARPVFIDIRPDTLNIDERQLERLITSQTRAIVPVHYAGVASEMDAILAIAARHRLEVVEDNAHGLFATYKGRNLGTLGSMATLSFHETKNFVCGEGGALVINDRHYVERAEIIREKGTNRSRFFRGQVDKYTWVDVGSSYLMGEILAAFLYAQLEARERIQAKRRFIWDYYFAHLQEWADQQDVRLPVVPACCEQPSHMFYMLMPTLEQRQSLISFLKEHEISAVFHYLPLHLSLMGQQLGGQPGDCPVTENVSDRLVRLPFYNDLTPADLERVVGAVRSWSPNPRTRH